MCGGSRARDAFEGRRKFWQRFTAHANAMTRSIFGHIDIGLTSVPEGRLVEVDDVAALAVHLMTDDARSITGAVFPVDAGRTAV